jgi:hypothetical protein
MKVATNVIIRYREGKSADSAIFRLSGNTSKKVMAIKVPVENAKKYCKIRLNLIAASPPTTVDRNVMKPSTNSM